MAANPPGSGEIGDTAPTDVFEARIIGSPEKLDSLLRSFDIDVGCSHPHFDRIDDRTYALFALIRPAQIKELEAAGYSVELGDNVSRRAEASKEIGTGDRFEGGRITPRGFGIKGGGRGKQDPQR